MFVAHYLVPLLMLVVATVHLVALHTTGSTSSLLVHSTPTSIRFSPTYVVKDALNTAVLVGLLLMAAVSPWALGDADT